MSVKKELYQSIKSALQEITDIKNVLHYNGQDGLNYEKDLSRRFPQSWIQLTSVPWISPEGYSYNKNRTRQQKSQAITVTIYLATFSLNEDDETFETDLDLIDKIYRKLDGLDGDHFTDLQRTNESDIPTNNNVRVWAQEYTTMLTEQAEEKTLVDVSPVELVITKSVI